MLFYNKIQCFIKIVINYQKIRAFFMNNIKIDINFLDKPLYFQNLRYEKNAFLWNDIEGYIYQSNSPPDYVDMLILLYLMLTSEQKNYQAEIELSRYKILKGCNLDTRWTGNYKRLEESLDRWCSVFIKFEGIFYDGKEYVSVGFGIIDSYKVDKKDKKVFVRFNAEWLLKIKESKFFKYINFEYYKKLKRPTSRRLYEILCKMFYDSDDWKIHAVKLGAKLGLSKRKVQTKAGIKEVMYASDVIVAIKPAINDVNSLPLIPNIVKDTGISPKNLFTIESEATGKGQSTIIHFKKISVALGKTVGVKQLPPPTRKVSQTKDDSTIDNAPFEKNPDIDQAKYQEVIRWLETIPYFNKKRRDEIMSMPTRETVELYPAIKGEYESLAKAGKTPKPGWVYKAFAEKWQFVSKVELQIPETPQGKQACKAKELFDSWNESQQQEFIEKLHDYVVKQMGFTDQEYQNMYAKGHVWLTWIPNLMEQLGLLPPIRQK
jgi:hypothetical protein